MLHVATHGPARQDTVEFTALPRRRTDIKLAAAPSAAALLLGQDAGAVSNRISSRLFMMLKYGEAEGSTGSRAPPPGDDGGSGGPEEARPNKRKRGDKGKGKEKDNGGKDSKGTVAPHPAGEGPKPRLACHFLRLNPLLYPACASYDCADYDAIKKHLERQHKGATDYHCPRCYRFFDSEDAKDQHIRDNRCTTVPGYDVITNAEWARVHDRRQANPCPWTTDSVQKWLWLWGKLFQDHSPPSPELVFLQDAAAEAMQLFSPAAVLSALQTCLPVYQPASLELAEAIREGVMRAAERRPQPYRKYLGPSGRGASAAAASGGVARQPPSRQATEPAIADAALLATVAQLLPAGQAALPGQGGQSPPSVAAAAAAVGTPTGGGAAAQPQAAGSDLLPAVPQGGPGLGLSPSALCPNLPLDDRGDAVLVYATFPLPMMTVRSAWQSVQTYPISWANLSSPQWGDDEVVPCIDWGWEGLPPDPEGVVPLVTVSIPILRDRLALFRAMEARGLADAGSGSGSGFGVGGGREIAHTWESAPEGESAPDEET